MQTDDQKKLVCEVITELVLEKAKPAEAKDLKVLAKSLLRKVPKNGPSRVVREAMKRTIKRAAKRLGVKVNVTEKDVLTIHNKLRARLVIKDKLSGKIDKKIDLAAQSFVDNLQYNADLSSGNEDTPSYVAKENQLWNQEIADATRTEQDKKELKALPEQEQKINIIKPEDVAKIFLAIHGNPEFAQANPVLKQHMKFFFNHVQNTPPHSPLPAEALQALHVIMICLIDSHNFPNILNGEQPHRRVLEILSFHIRTQIQGK